MPDRPRRTRTGRTRGRPCTPCPGHSSTRAPPRPLATHPACRWPRAPQTGTRPPRRTGTGWRSSGCTAPRATPGRPGPAAQPWAGACRCRGSSRAPGACWVRRAQCKAKSEPQAKRTSWVRRAQCKARSEPQANAPDLSWRAGTRARQQATESAHPHCSPRGARSPGGTRPSPAPAGTRVYSTPRHTPA